MNNFSDSCLLGELAKAVTGSGVACQPSPFKTRPVMARTSERNTVYARFNGAIGLSDRDDFIAALGDLVTAKLVKAILDFSEVTLTRSAVGILVGFAASMHGRNKRLYLYRCSAQVTAMLDDLKLAPFFSYLETEDDIIATLEV